MFHSKNPSEVNLPVVIHLKGRPGGASTRFLFTYNNVH